MKGILGIAGVTLRETLRSGVIILLPLYAVFLGCVIAYYPSIDEETSFRQALSYGHEALQFGIGMICLLVGITTVAGDRESRRAVRCVSTRVGGGGYVIGKGMALVGFAVVFGLSLWAVEVGILRWSFRDRTELLRAHPLLEPISFDVLPGGGLGKMNVPRDIHPLIPDRVKWRFPRPAEPAEAVVLDLRVDPESRGKAILRIRAPKGRGFRDYPLEGAGPFVFPLPPWPDGEPVLDVILLHTSWEEIRFLGDPREARTCRMRTAGGELMVPLPPDEELWQGVSEGEILFQGRWALWRFPEEEAGRALRGRVDPILARASFQVSLRRTGTPLSDRITFPAEAGRSFLIPEAIRQGEGDLLVRVRSESEVFFDFEEGPDGAPRSSLVLTGDPEAVEWTLLVGAMAAVCQGILLACLGMAASLVFSTPAALVFGIGVFLVGLGGGLLEEIPDHGAIYDPIREVFGYETGASQDLVRLAVRASKLVPDMARFDLKGRILGSYSLGAGVLPGLVLYAAGVAVASLLVGGLLFRRMDFR